jgi:26S proteasome regulatory subunit N2
METVQIHSSEGISALLYEKDDDLIVYGLQKMLLLVDRHWAEIATHMSHLEGLYERESFKYREIAALILSKLFYHLSEYQEALNYALLAGDYFDVNDKSEFVETMLTKILDTYMELRKNKVDQQKEDTLLLQLLSNRIERIVEQMLGRLGEKEYRQAVGIAIECRRADLVIKALQLSNDLLESAHYVLTILSTTVLVGEFYHTIMNALIEIFKSEQDYVSVSRCYTIMSDGDAMGDLLLLLMNNSGSSSSSTSKEEEEKNKKEVRGDFFSLIIS